MPRPPLITQNTLLNMPQDGYYMYAKFEGVMSPATPYKVTLQDKYKTRQHARQAKRRWEAVAGMANDQRRWVKNDLTHTRPKHFPERWRPRHGLPTNESNKIRATTRRTKAFEKPRQVKTNAYLHTFQDIYSARGDTTKAKIIAGPPEKIFTHVENVGKNTRNTSKLTTIKTKKGMVTN